MPFGDAAITAAKPTPGAFPRTTAARYSFYVGSPELSGYHYANGKTFGIDLQTNEESDTRHNDPSEWSAISSHFWNITTTWFEEGKLETLQAFMTGTTPTPPTATGTTKFRFDPSIAPFELWVVGWDVVDPTNANPVALWVCENFIVTGANSTIDPDDGSQMWEVTGRASDVEFVPFDGS